MKSQYGEPEADEHDPVMRAHRLEERYSYRRDTDATGESGLSTVAYVSAYRDELAQEFFRWWETQPERQRADAALVTWESLRFGATLERAAHGVLWFAVRGCLIPDRVAKYLAPRAPALRRTEGLTDEQRKERMLVALDKLAEGKRMPEGPQ